MGCGKTLTALAVMGAGYLQNKISKVLVVAPTSVCAVWEKDTKQFLDVKYDMAMLLGTKTQRLKALADLKKSDGLQIAVINYESVWRDEIFAELKDFGFDMCIADESQRIKTYNSRQSKGMHALGDIIPYKIILSGTPVSNSAIDLYSQYRFCDSEVFGKNFFAFRNKYAVMGGFQKHQIVAYKNLDDLIRREYSIAYRVTKQDALDLPEQMFLTREVHLESYAKAMYDRLKRDAFLELQGEAQVTAPTVLTKLLRLQQFTGGFLRADGAETDTRVSLAKADALKDILEDYVLGESKKLVVFVRFRAEIDLIEDILKKMNIGYQSLYGDVPLTARGDMVADFQTNPKTKVFVAQIDTAGLGITLTAADTCVYYSLNYNYASYEQSLSRIHRIGQKNACTYIHLVAKGTVDELVLEALNKKQDLAQSIVDDWKRLFE